MKNRILILDAILILTVLVFIANSITPKKTYAQEKPTIEDLVGTWINEEMKQFAVGRVIRKDRYKFKSGAYKGWLIDIFDKESAFREMAIAEIELPDLKASLPDVPDYIDIRKENDISELSDFENKNLSLYGPPDLMFLSKW